MSCPDEHAFVAFADGRLPPEAEARFDSHVAACAGCRTVLGAFANARSVPHADATTTAPFPAAAIPLVVGGRFSRYVILSWLGSGGMGVVHRAYDPELDRQVALKTWRPHRAPGAESVVARHAREAKAMAQVSHPNVIHVYETGVFDGQVFLAMEFIDGMSLRAWQAAARSWREILAMYLQAGRGLAAAHAAKIVHRDFKPENVLVGNDGRARVTDFGLARREVGDTTSSFAPSPGAGGDFATSTTAGTPAYMAPEQRSGVASARSDQYSFCVALYEALFGHHPHAVDPARRTTRWARSVPAFVRAALRRGLSFDPDARARSMDALLDALARDPRKTWLRRAAWVLPTAAIVASVLVPLRARSQTTDTCVGSERKLGGIWDPARREAARTAFAKSGAPDANATFDALDRALGRTTDAWVLARTDACGATRRRHEQSSELMDLRFACLDRQLKDLRATTDLLVRADRRTVDAASQLAEALGRPEECADSARLRARVPVPNDPAVRARIDALETRLSELQALQMTGRFDEAARIVSAVDAEAHAIGYAPLEADVVVRVGLYDLQSGRVDAAARHFEAGIFAAERARDDHQRAFAATKLALVLGRYQRRFAEAAVAATFAAAAIERGGASDELRAELEDDRAGIEHQRKNFPAAREHAARCIEYRTKAFGPEDYRVGEGYYHLAMMDLSLAHYDSGLAAVTRAAVLLEPAYHGDHPNYAFVIDLQANLLLRLGRATEAIPLAERALAILGRAKPPLPSEMVGSEMRAAIALTSAERDEEALRHLDAAIERSRAATGPESAKTVLATGMRAALLRLQKRQAHAPTRAALVAAWLEGRAS